MNKFRPGQHKKICDRTGFAVYSDDVKKEWNGKIVRKKSWEKRHPQDLVRAVPESPGVPDARPRPEYRFVAINEVTVDSL